MLARQVATVHDIAMIDHPEWFNARFAAWYHWMTPRLVRRASHVIAVSKFTKRRLIEVTGVDESRVSVVPNGMDTRFGPRPPEEVAAIRPRVAIPSSSYVLSLGTLEPRKNLSGQLEGWSDAYRSCQTVCVWRFPAGRGRIMSSAIFNCRMFRFACISRDMCGMKTFQALQRSDGFSLSFIL